MHTRAGKKLGRGVDHFVEEGNKKVQPDDAARSRGWDSMADEVLHLAAEADALWHRVERGDVEGLSENRWTTRDETWVPPAHRDKPKEDPAEPLFDDWSSSG